MSRKHNTKHPERKPSNYPDRLAARGLGKAPALLDSAMLAKRQERRAAETGVPWKIWSENEES